MEGNKNVVENAQGCQGQDTVHQQQQHQVPMTCALVMQQSRHPRWDRWRVETELGR